jgi:Lar family restriction alleviation protein
MNKKLKLKPCPFCGSEAHSYAQSPGLPIGNIICRECGVNMEGVNEENAIHQWNRRTGEMKRWKAGSNPPDGVYLEYEYANLLVVVNKGKLSWAECDDLVYWSSYPMPLNDFLHKYRCRCIYGPIPIPEMET